MKAFFLLLSQVLGSVNERYEKVLLGLEELTPDVLNEMYFEFQEEFQHVHTIHKKLQSVNRKPIFEEQLREVI